jgi:acyl-CoA synthetase (NDP forming)
VNPKYTITVGNQLDLTASDYLAYLKDDPEITVFAAYVEGFAPHDGLRFMQLAREITRSGRAVILYQAGRTRAGARAAASHTASIAGDAVVTRALAGQAGIVMADSLMAFDALVRIFTVFEDRRPAGRRIGAVTNAGYESVAIADLLDGLRMATFSDETETRLHALLAQARLTGVVEVHNPLDLTPMADDATYEEAVRVLLDDPGVDVGVVGIVPFTTALQTLPAGVVPEEDVATTGSVAGRLQRVWRESAKPWLMVVDAGPRYDPLATQLAAAGIPVFRTADAALRTLAAVCAVMTPA